MKKITRYIILIATFATSLSACNKDDPEPPPDTRFPLPSITKAITGEDFIAGRDPKSFLGEFVVDLYYGTEVRPQSVDVVVIKNGNKTNAKTIKANLTNFPVNIQVTGVLLTTLFGSKPMPGDEFKIGADVTTLNGERYPAFPITGNPYGADTTTLPGSSLSIAYYVTDCTFDIASFDGFYTVVNSVFEYNAGDSIEVRPGNGNSILVTAWPHAENWSGWDYTRVPMVVDIDPVTLAATVAPQEVGEYCCGGPRVFILEGTGTASRCGDSITLSIHLGAEMLTTYPVLVLTK